MPNEPKLSWIPLQTSVSDALKAADIYYQSADGKLIARVATGKIAKPTISPIPQRITQERARMLTDLTEFFMGYTEDEVPNAQLFYHENEELYERFALETGTDIEHVTIQKRLNMIPIMCTVRGKPTDKPFHGKLDFVPELNDGTTRCAISFEEFVEQLNALGYDGINLANQMKQYSILNANLIAEYCNERGVILTSITVEFGIDPSDGKLYLAGKNGSFDRCVYANMDRFQPGTQLDEYRDFEDPNSFDNDPDKFEDFVNLASSRYSDLYKRLTERDEETAQEVNKMKWIPTDPQNGYRVYDSEDGELRLFAINPDDFPKDEMDDIEACSTIIVTEACVNAIIEGLGYNPTALVIYEEGTGSEHLYQHAAEDTGEDVDTIRIEVKTARLPLICGADFTSSADADPDNLPRIYFRCECDENAKELTVEEAAACLDTFLEGGSVTAKKTPDGDELSGKYIAETIAGLSRKAARILSGYYDENMIILPVICFTFGISEDGRILFTGEMGTIDCTDPTIIDEFEDSDEEGEPLEDSDEEDEPVALAIDSNYEVAELLGLIEYEEEGSGDSKNDED